MSLFIRTLNKLQLLPMMAVVTGIKLSGAKFRIPVINRLGLANIALKPDWLRALLIRIKTTDEMVFVDVGANIGQTILQVKSLHPGMRYVAFEPNPNCVFYLTALVRLNRMQDVTIVPAGIGQHTSLEVLNKLSETDTGASVRHDPQRKVKDVISIFRLDDIFGKVIKEGDKVVMKVDVEGFELEALKGMRDFLKEVRPTLIIEILDSLRHDRLEDKRRRNDEVFQLLSSQGYNAFRIIKNTQVTQIEKLEPVSRIETVMMTRKKYNLHDYLFLPQEAVNPF